MMNFRFEVMQTTDLDSVMAIEELSQSNPWTKKNFIDCINEKYWNYLLVGEDNQHQVLGHCILMPGVDELHLLNISIDPQFRRNHIAWRALLAIEKTGNDNGYAKILLEVRRSNIAAVALYEKLGYLLIGARKGYYPKKDHDQSQREDALVMEKILN